MVQAHLLMCHTSFTAPVTQPPVPNTNCTQVTCNIPHLGSNQRPQVWQMQHTDSIKSMRLFSWTPVTVAADPHFNLMQDWLNLTLQAMTLRL